LQPSYLALIAHHRAKALSSFKANLDSALEGTSGEGFASIVRRSSATALADFDRGCAGMSGTAFGRVFVFCVDLNSVSDMSGVLRCGSCALGMGLDEGEGEIGA
jgi:hypothetical protein